MTFAERIRRAIHGPTEEEISAQSQALGGPPYPIPPTSTTPPTNTTHTGPYSGPLLPADADAPNPRTRFATGEYIPDLADRAVEHADDPDPGTIRPMPRMTPETRARYLDAAANLRPAAPAVALRPIDTPAGRATAFQVVRDYHARQAVELQLVARRHLTDQELTHPGRVPGTTAQIVADAGSAIPPIGRPYHVPDLNTMQGEPMTGPIDYDTPERYPSDTDQPGRRRAPEPATGPGAINPADLTDVSTMTDADLPNPVTDSGIHATTPDDNRSVRVPCTTCEGHGYVTKTVNDLLRESLALLGDNGDSIIREFYKHLLHAAPDLAPLFPADLLGADTAHHQRDRLLKALVALADLYDPNNPDSMNRLETALRAFGRSHAAFARPDGTTRGATMREYVAVGDTLMGTLHAAAGNAWIPAYDDAWDEAYYHAADIMRDEQRRTSQTFPRYPRQDA